MKQVKKTSSLIAVYAIVMGLYALAFLIIPFVKTAVSWISFVFTLIAMGGSLYVCKVAFGTEETVVSKVYGIPIFTISVRYVAIQFVMGVVFCVLGALLTVPYWVALLPSLILLGWAVIGVIITDNTRDIVEEIDERTKTETRTFTCFQINIAGIVDACRDEQLKKELQKLNEAFRFSDPVSNEMTKSAEDGIREMLYELRALVEGDAEAELIRDMIRRITLALNERNRICVASKS